MQCRPSISSMSLGRAWAHDMRGKLSQAAQSGFEGIEIFYEDLEYLADTLPTGRSREGLLKAAGQVRAMCDEFNLYIINLQPFTNFDGLRDRSRTAARLDELKFWCELVKVLRTDMIQIPATFLPADETTGDMNVIVADLRAAADIGAAAHPPVRFAYESLCFSTWINTWELCWEVVQKVDRPNFGVCLDTFNIAGRTYADPASPSGLTANAAADTAASIRRLVDTVDVDKIFFVQVVDAERLSDPLVAGHDFYVESQPARMSWSRNCRLFYGEQERGGYLPVKAITQAIINGLGFRGWVSMELFNRSMADTDASVPAEHARRGMASWAKIRKDTRLSASSATAELPTCQSSVAADMFPLKHDDAKSIASRYPHNHHSEVFVRL